MIHTLDQSNLKAARGQNINDDDNDGRKSKIRNGIEAEINSSNYVIITLYHNHSSFSKY